MPITIGSNIASYRAQRALDTVTNRQQSTLERLSSGMRINKAADDAAGLAVSTSLNLGARVYTQAQRNLSDGVSMLSIADGATEQLQKVVDRQSELAAQSANGVYSDTQRQALDIEFQQLSEEYNRIIQTTEFNGKRIFDTRSTTFQAGFGVDETLRLALGESANRLPTGVTQVSTDSTESVLFGIPGSSSSAIPSLSVDGRYVTFAAAATLVSGDANGVADIFIRDTLLGTTELVSTSSNGTQANGASSASAVSADGRYVAFYSDATNLVASDSNGVGDIFLKDMITGTTTLVSSNASGTQANGASVSNRLSISDDGRYVAFLSGATNLVANDTNGQNDTFVKDMVTGTVVRVNTTSSGAEAAGDATMQFRISGDGRYVVFASSASTLVEDDTNGVADVFRKDLLTGATTLVSRSEAGQVQNGAALSALRLGVSQDGRFVSFTSAATNLLSGDSNGTNDVYVKDLVTGKVTAASTAEDGTFGNGSSSDTSISADGRYVAFESVATNFVQNDTADRNYFVKDLLTGELDLVSKDSSGAKVAVVQAATGISGDGRYTLFMNPTSSFSNRNFFIARSDGEQSSSTAALGDHHGLYVTSQIAARYALDRLNLYRDELTTVRGDIGSALSRFDVAGRTLQVRTENYIAARSRIVDADIAEESSLLVRQGILQQAASSILGQANQQPALALSLLQD